MRRRLAALALLLTACSTRDDIRVVERPASPQTQMPANERRFELVETAAIETGKQVELWFPLASAEAGVQDVERLDVTIKPDAPYEVSNDSRGNRLLHVARAGPIEVSVSYRVRRSELRVDHARAEKRDLTPRERSMLGSELAETIDGEVGLLRGKGQPARRVLAFRIDSHATKVRRDLEPASDATDVPQESWIEVYEPGLAWVPVPGPDGRSVISPSLLIVARGTETAVPFAKVDGAEASPSLGWRIRQLETP